MILPPPPSTPRAATMPRTAPLPRQLTQSQADEIAQRLRITEAVYTGHIVALETYRLAPPCVTVRPGRRR